MGEKFTNRAISQLSSPINNSVTTLTVASASSFPSSGNFRIKVDDEYMLVTGVSSNTFTVTRAHEGTLAASHASGANVTHVLTVGALKDKQIEMVLRGPIASLPSAGTAGRIYQTTDSIYRYYDNGSSWVATGPQVPLDFNSFNIGNWVQVGSGTVRYTSYPGSILFDAPTGAGTFGYISANPPSTPYTVTFGFTANYFPANYNQSGVGWRDNSTGRIQNFCWTWTAVTQKLALEILNWNDGTSFNGVVKQVSALQCFHMGMIFFRLENTGTVRNYYYSSDKFHWILFYTCPVNEWTATPDRLTIYSKWDGVGSASGVQGHNWMWLANYELA